MEPRPVDLPLKYNTPDEWAAAVLREPLALLNDHAWLERKAAGNALELLNRWPEPNPPEYWVERMTAIARDEVEHLAIVTRLLARRGGRLTRSHRNEYASGLHALVRRGAGPDELIDRLMVSALIEARSCERFELLSRHCDDPELRRLYADLWASENGHYRTFIDLAIQVHNRPAAGAARRADAAGVAQRAAAAVPRRWDEMLTAEAAIIRAQPPGPRMHSGAG